MKLKKIFIALGIFLLPAIAFAQNFQYINNWLGTALTWLNFAVTAIMILMTLFFLYRVFQLISAKDAAKQAERRKEMFNALLGLFIAVSVWGIIRLAGNITGVGQQENGNYVPTVVCPPGESPTTSGTCS